MKETMQVWIDRGGTFTDCLGVFPCGEMACAKVLSSDSAPLQGIRVLLSLRRNERIPPCEIKMGTTIATNALLERKGVRQALLITRGFKDTLAIGTQQRPELFDLRITLPSVLPDKIIEVDERLAANGRVLQPADPAVIRRELDRLRRDGYRNVAVVLLHGYAHPRHEKLIAGLARQAGMTHVACSHEVCPEIGLTGRGDTTTVDAYLTPLLINYMNVLHADLPGSTLMMMQSSGGLIDAAHFRGANAIMSGPAAGVVACARLGEWFGYDKLIGFDMGGTSTDVSRYDGAFEYTYETVTAGVRIKAPMVRIHTVAAGGGSICRCLAGRLTAGPDSAGADPGPLCYGLTDKNGRPKARELTVTDINCFLGRVIEDNFPMNLHKPPVAVRLRAVQAELKKHKQDLGLARIAEGFLEVINLQMAQAVKEISVAQGRDVREYTLCSFGGAGGQHACAVARHLGIQKVLLHPYGGVLSAYGIGLADTVWSGSAPVKHQPLNDVTRKNLGPIFARLMRKGGRLLKKQGFNPVDMYYVLKFDLRYTGTDNAITVSEPKDMNYLRAFTEEHRKLYGYVRENRPVEILQVRVDVIGRTPHPRPPKLPRTGRGKTPAPVRIGQTIFDGRMLRTPVYQRDGLTPGACIKGPALILEKIGTIVVEPGFRAAVDDYGNIVLEQTIRAGAKKYGSRADPVALEVFNNLFMSTAQQMGKALQRTAVSTNIKERLDFSCALFDARGDLVANAPHIPVHLGAMGQSVRAVMVAHPRMKPGDVFVTNNPFDGGTHLPDITVVTPVFYKKTDRRPAFFTASRAHHADVGGVTPGSIPPFSRTIAEEGVLLDHVKLVSCGRFQEQLFERMFSSGDYPARNLADNLADLQAQIAANRLGARLLEEMCGHYGIKTVLAYMRHVRDNAARQVRDALARIPDGVHEFEDALDNGAPICARITVRGRRAAISFKGSAPQQDDNLNAPPAVVRSCVLYVLRSLVKEPIPLNDGCLAPVSITIPPGSVLNPSPGRAVVGGNVETSQRVVDCLLGALGLAAASQGTMNNLAFGDRHFGYYETIAGGVGAADGYHGADAVHTHMTNTRITDPEVLETRFPVRLAEFRIRPLSGGKGLFRGGCGAVRSFIFLKDLDVSLLTERRVRAPFGLKGGSAGQPGRNVLVLANGTKKILNGKVSLRVKRGDRLEVHTPGGGGFGRKT